MARRVGVFSGAAVDRADGYIHFSTADQAPETAAKWFAGRDDLISMCWDGRAVGEDAINLVVAKVRKLGVAPVTRHDVENVWAHAQINGGGT